jgi:hypothetical protein
MEHSHELSAAIDRANQIRERERVRTIGWFSLTLAVGCWCMGGVFWLLCFHRGDSASFVFFGVTASLIAAAGCGLAYHALRSSAERCYHVLLALTLNELFLLTALTYAIRLLM